MNTAHNQSNQEDEIDLGILLLKITKSISKYKFLIILFSLIGVGLGVSAYYAQKPKYESDMIVQSSILTGAYTKTLSQNLNQLVKEQNYSLLAGKLSIDEQHASQVTMISITTVAEEIIRKANGEEIFDNLFKISVEIKENSLLPQLQNGILAYLENSPYVKKQIVAKKSGLTALIKKVELELSAIDSMKSSLGNAVSYNTTNENNIVIFDPTNIYSRSLSFYKDKIHYEQELAIINGVQLIDGFVPFEKPASPKLSMSIVVGFAIGLFFAFGFIIFRELRDYLKKLDEEITTSA